MIKIKTETEIQIMKEGGSILAKILNQMVVEVKPGVTTESLDKLASELILKYGAEPSFLGYDNYPAVSCISLNDEVVHGVPSDRKLEEGDVCKIDFGILYKGFHTDSAITVLVGGNFVEGFKTSTQINSIFKTKTNLSEKRKLIKVTRQALEIGISKAWAGNSVGDIGWAVQQFVEGEGFGLIRDLVGHGIGRELHEPPQVPNYGEAGMGEKLAIGMVIAIEPMVVTGDWKVKVGKDGFVYKTKDGSLAAHFEHTVAITEDGPMILTN